MKREAHDRSLRLKALTVAVTFALTDAAQAAVAIPESSPEGANGNSVKITKENELTKLHLSGQGWGQRVSASPSASGKRRRAMNMTSPSSRTLRRTRPSA